MNQIFQIEHKLLRIPTGGRLTSWLLHNAVEELNSGLPIINPGSARMNQGPPDFKSSALNHPATPPHNLRLQLGKQVAIIYFT